MADQQQTPQYVVSGALAHGERYYHDGEFFESAGASEADIAQLVTQGVLVTPQRHAQMAAAYAIGGSSDVEAVLTRLRGEREGHILAAEATLEQMEDPGRRAEREGHHNAALARQHLRSEHGGRLEAAKNIGAQITQIEQAGQPAGQPAE